MYKLLINKNLRHYMAFAVLLAACFSSIARADATPLGDSYMLTEHWGGQWQDVEKSPASSDDNDMCWAAAASNILYWGGWADFSESPGPFADADAVFDYYTDHWTDAGSLMNCAWRWWIDGYNPNQGFSGWSQVVTPGGGFYQGESYYDYYSASSFAAMAMANIYNGLTSGSGVALAIYSQNSSGGLSGHAVSVWGINYDFSQTSPYLGVWITDSDDNKTILNPDDRLRYYEVAYSSSDAKWYLQDYFGKDSWYIGAVQSLAAIPEPAGAILLLLGLPLIKRRRSI